MRRAPPAVRVARGAGARGLPRAARGDRKKSWAGRVDALLADLGVSSFQLDDPARGFSFVHDGPLDMRMDRASGGPTAADLLRALPEDELARLFRDGDEPHARRIARAIARRRREEPVTSTRDLAALIEGVKPRERQARIHPATLAFQALRVAVNRELDGLDAFVRDAARVLAPQGRMAVISFHGGEDRVVKNALRDLAGRCTCPPEALRCECGRRAVVRILTKKPVRPDARETAENPRSRSARLRAAERIAEGAEVA